MFRVLLVIAFSEVIQTPLNSIEMSRCMLPVKPVEGPHDMV